MQHKGEYERRRRRTGQDLRTLKLPRGIFILLRRKQSVTGTAHVGNKHKKDQPGRGT